MHPQGPRSPRTPMGSQKRRSIKGTSTYSSPVPVLDSSARYAVSSSPSINNDLSSSGGPPSVNGGGGNGNHNRDNSESSRKSSIDRYSSSSPKKQQQQPSSPQSVIRRSLSITGGGSRKSKEEEPPEDIEHKAADHHVKIVCVGDGGCGKTCLMVTYAHGTFPENYVPTVFENYLTKVKAPSGKLVELALWDTAGQEEYDRLRALSYPEVNVLLVCFSIEAPPSLDNVYDKWIPEIAHHCPGVPFLLVGLKTDLREDMTSIQHLRSKGQRPITTEEGKKVAQKLGAYKYLECSAREGQGINEIFNQSIAIVLNDHRGLRKPSGADAKKQIPRPANHSITQHDPVIHDTQQRPTTGPVPPSMEKRKKKKKKCIIL